MTEKSVHNKPAVTAIPVKHPKVSSAGQYEEVSMSAKKDTQKSVGSTTTNGKKKGFSADERAAMKERARELKAEAERADGENALVAKLAEMTGSDRVIGERLHALIKASAPTLAPKTWYGMPAYANKEGQVVCFFTSAQKFNTRYATFGFNES